MTVFGSHGRARTEEFAAGDVGYVPQGYGHYIENLGSEELEVVIVLNNGTYRIDLADGLDGGQPDPVAGDQFPACRRRPSRASPSAKRSCRSDARSRAHALEMLRQLTDQVAELGLVDGVGGVVEAEPAGDALALLGPGVQSLGDRQREHLDRAPDRKSVVEQLLVVVAADRPLVDLSDQAGFLARFARGAIPGRLALGRPAFRNDPAAGIARGDQHDLDGASSARRR